jgi:hypothetical protein
LTFWLTGSATCCLTKVNEIHESFSTLNTLAVVSHVYAYFILSCGCGKRREIMNLMNIETVIGQRFLCGVNCEIMAWIVKLWRESVELWRESVELWRESRICWRVSWYCGVISLFVREWPLSAIVSCYF